MKGQQQSSYFNDQTQTCTEVPTMNSTNTLPPDFRQTLLERHEFPRNLVQKGVYSYPRALDSFADRLDAAEHDLCQSDIGKVEVYFRDLKTDNGSDSGKDLNKRNIHTPQALTAWLGLVIGSSQLPPDGIPEVQAQIKDPKCRFIYLSSDHSRARLNITRPMLAEILTFHQVLPDYLNFLLAFGVNNEPLELRFSSFREQVSLGSSSIAPEIGCLARSGKQFEVCYNLKGISEIPANANEPMKNTYSIRQAAFYHKFDVVEGNSLWMVTEGVPNIRHRLKELTGPNSRPRDRSFGNPEECLRSSLSAHLLFAHWSTEDWRGYVKRLEYILNFEITTAVAESAYYEGHYDRVYTAADVMRLHAFRETFDEAITTMESNIEVMNSLMKFYTRLAKNVDFKLRITCGGDIDTFASQLINLGEDLRRQAGQAAVLLKLIVDRTNLVEQHRLERLNRNMEREAIIMRIVTIVALIYLPATFVSTFFSTDIIKYQGQASPSGNFSSVAMNRWLQVTLPLTAITLAMAYLSKRWAHGAESRKQGSPDAQAGRQESSEEKQFRFRFELHLQPLSWIGKLQAHVREIHRRGREIVGRSKPNDTLLPVNS